MKKSFFKIMLSFAVTAFVVSCSGDDNGGALSSSRNSGCHRRRPRVRERHIRFLE